MTRMNKQGSETSRPLRSFLAWLGPVAVLAVGVVSAAWLTLFAGVGRAGFPVALVFPPGWTPTEVFGGVGMLDLDFAESTSVPFVVIVVPRSDKALDQIRTSGALVALRSVAAGLCGRILEV